MQYAFRIRSDLQQSQHRKPNEEEGSSALYGHAARQK